MRVGIYGMGYVGLTTAACLLSRGHCVVGFEASETKRRMLAQGVCPLREPGVEESLREAASAGSFTVQADMRTGGDLDLVLVCVGTPSLPDGSTDISAVLSVFRQLDGLDVPAGGKPLEVVLRSTVPPGTLLLLRTEFPGLFGRAAVSFFPEFLREGTAIRDFFSPPQTVFGVPSGGRTPVSLPALLVELGFEHETVDSTTAETLKFACNAFHALKVSFANEVGRLAGTLGADGTEVMRLFIKDTVLNVSHRYLRPGTPYGGSCLPKDTRAFVALGARNGLDLPLVAACESSNARHAQFLVQRVARLRPRRVAVLGLTFKVDTDDVRESPAVALVKGLVLELGCEVAIHDLLLRRGEVVGVNAQVLETVLSLNGVHLCGTAGEAVVGSDVTVLMHDDPRLRAAAESHSVPVMDFARWKMA